MKFVTDKDSNAEPGFRSSIDFQTPIITEAQLLMRQPLPPLGILGSNVAPQAPCLRQVEFEMYVLDPQNIIVHTYTKTQSEIGSARKFLEDVETWKSAYPDLALNYDEPHQYGEVILFETDFRLMENHPTLGSKLGVDFFVDITRGMEFKDWKYKTKFYEKGVPVQFQESVYTPEDTHKATLAEEVSGHLKHSQASQSSDARLEIAFRSSWWVAVFFNMTNKRLKIAEETNQDPHALKQEEERAGRYLQEMSVMQEVFATPRTGAMKQQRVCTFLWKFRLDQNNPVATTTWRKLNLPIPKVKAESPAPSPITPFYQPSMTLDTALRHTTCPQPNPLYAEHFDHSANSLFAENSESILAAHLSESDSSSSTPTAHHAYFSTTASYESSRSCSTLPHLTHHSPWQTTRKTSAVPLKIPQRTLKNLPVAPRNTHFHPKSLPTYLKNPCLTFKTPATTRHIVSTRLSKIYTTCPSLTLPIPLKKTSLPKDTKKHSTLHKNKPIRTKSTVKHP